MAAANLDRAAPCRADGGLAVETATHGNRRSKSVGTKVRRHKSDPASGPALASGGPIRTLLHQSATGIGATSKVPARTTARPARRDGTGRNPTSEIRHPAFRLRLHRGSACRDPATREARTGEPSGP